MRAATLTDLGPARRPPTSWSTRPVSAPASWPATPTLTGVRGQVVRVADPGLAGWTLDEDHPDGMVYVVPRGTDVVCGGTARRRRRERPRPDPAEAERILARCRALVPELADAPVLGHAVGVRPVRTAVRLERAGDVVHCYGHGGAGVTLSWGCADEVVRLVG